MAVALAVVAKENYPIYVRTASPGNELKFLYTIHTSIDVIEEKISSISKTAGDLRELYLGLLYPTEDYKVYGYVTNTKIKLVVVVESSHLVLRDNEIRQMFRRIHGAYTDMVCDPFYVPGETPLVATMKWDVDSVRKTRSNGDNLSKGGSKFWWEHEVLNSTAESTE